MASRNHSTLSATEKKEANARSIKSRRKLLSTNPEAQERYRAQARRFHDENPKTIILYHARQRAKRDGLPCTISEDDFEIPAACPVLGIPLKREKDRCSSGSPTLDKMIPALGYIPGNVVVMSARANRLKCDCINSAELLAVAAWIDKHVKA